MRGRRRGSRRALATSCAFSAAALFGLLAGSPVAGLDPLPSPPIDLPSLPLPPPPTIALPLPTVPPLPTIALPTLPVPLPTLPAPTVSVPSLPVPTLPVPSMPLPSNPLASQPASTSSAPPSSGAPTGAPGASDMPGGSVAASPTSALLDVAGPVEGTTETGQGGSPFGFALPLLIAGIPIALIIAIVALQILGGAAWLPVIRRWLNRRLTPPA